MNNRLKHLLSLPFIFCLVLLILNDFYLKATFHNALTGKLSDFCGLFIFPIFWSAIFPKHRSGIFILTGLLFIYWKSEFASGFIEWMSSYVFPIHRTVDLTDLIALPVLFFAWFQTSSEPKPFVSNSLTLRLSSFLVAGVTIFSFCATTQPRYLQSFDKPQYLLFKSTAPDSLYANRGDDFYRAGSLLVVKVNDSFTSTRPVKNDDYNKNLDLKGLEEYIFAGIAEHAKRMPPKQVIHLHVKTLEGVDALRFKGGRMDGKFIRTKGGKILIEGFYKMGIEDSTWTIRDTSSTVVIKQKYVNGERTEIKQFDNNKLISTDTVNTRADTIRIKYVQIMILVLLAAGTIFLLIRNYRKAFPTHVKIKAVWKWLLCLISPIIVWFFHFGVRMLLQDYNQDIFETFAAIIFIYIVTFPIMVIAIFWIKLRNEFDVLLYCMLLGLLASIYTAVDLVIELSR